MTGVWQTLRQQTQPIHRQLEQVPLLARLFADDLRLDELGAVLEGMARVQGGLEPVLAGSPAAMAIGYRPRLPLLRAGLATLGRPLPPPAALDTAALATAARQWGALYVVEGSILGGEVIRRRLLGQFGAAVAATIGFFTPYGDAAGPQWTRFRTGLEDAVTTPAALDDAIAAATATFALFSSTLTSMHKLGG